MIQDPHVEDIYWEVDQDYQYFLDLLVFKQANPLFSYQKYLVKSIL